MDWNAKQSSTMQESLREAVLRDTLARAGENDSDTFQTVLNNLMTYVEVVYHNDYNADLIKCKLHDCTTIPLLRLPLVSRWHVPFIAGAASSGMGN